MTLVSSFSAAKRLRPMSGRGMEVKREKDGEKVCSTAAAVTAVEARLAA